MKITTIGIDLAKEIFQIHAVDEHGKAVLRKQSRRSEMAKFFANLEPCLIGMEACRCIAPDRVLSKPELRKQIRCVVYSLSLVS